MTITRNIGMLLLGIWLILTALLPLAGINAPYLGIFMAILALFSGIFILIGR